MTSLAQTTIKGTAGLERERPRPFGLEAQIDLSGCEPQAVREESTYRLCIPEIIATIHMEAEGELILKRFGTGELEGWTGMIIVTQWITTSDIWIVARVHGYEQPPPRVCLNVFSCQSFEPVDVAEAAKRHFGAGNYTIRTCYRGES
jgi:hypothetical protein